MGTMGWTYSNADAHDYVSRVLAEGAADGPGAYDISAIVDELYEHTLSYDFEGVEPEVFWAVAVKHAKN